MQPVDPDLARELGRILSPDRVLSRPIDRLGRSVDASIYRLIPEVVVRPSSIEEMRGLFACARRRRRHLTFRTAGTSLSGQSVTDGILVELGPFWKASRVLNGGRLVWFQPGVVAGYLNRVLAPLGYRLGPDPASVDAAMMGGILANNSSGMCCGTAYNSYHTLESLKLLLADGTLVDTAATDADAALHRQNGRLHAELARIRDEVRGEPVLSQRIRRKFSRKNTMGYSLNALLDYERPADILAHLMIGSQGTLGFIAEATLRGVPEAPARATALAYFDELSEAGAAVAPLARAGAAALEIMDATCLRSQREERVGPGVGERTAALLIEFRASDAAALEPALTGAMAALRAFRLLSPLRFTSDPGERDELWRLRRGLLATTGALRPQGTSVVIEDVVVPVERLAEGIADLQALFERHGYRDVAIVGHAKDGNLHFLLAEDFGGHEAVANYGRFMRGLADLVVGKYDGALKAEHGSGRNMAPFVREEWGDAAYALMQRIKGLLDPDGVLNPGVLLNADPEVHLKNLKPLPSISPLADRCIECGFCEPRCPSRDLTLSPRQRIVVTREMARLAALGTPEALSWRRSLRRDFAYEGIETCAGDSMCQTACPVRIDAGALVKEMRAAAHGRWASRTALAAAAHWEALSSLVRIGLGLAASAGSLPGGRSLLPLALRIPAGLALPGPAPRLPEVRRKATGKRVVYFPSCLTRVLGPLPGESAMPVADAMLDVLDWAGFAVAYPEGLGGLCCGMPLASKGFGEAAQRLASATASELWRASREGRDAVVTDASPCAKTLADLAAAGLAAEHVRLRVLDFPAFWAADVLPGSKGTPRRRPGLAILHPTCTLVGSGGLPDLLRVAEAHSDSVLVPASAECCGFAGDRGFFVPELTEAATAREASEVRERAGEGAGLYSTCRTCEIGMGRAVGRAYRSIIHLVREAVKGG